MRLPSFSLLTSFIFIFVFIAAVSADFPNLAPAADDANNHIDSVLNDNQAFPATPEDEFGADEVITPDDDYNVISTPEPEGEHVPSAEQHDGTDTGHDNSSQSPNDAKDAPAQVPSTEANTVSHLEDIPSYSGANDVYVNNLVAVAENAMRIERDGPLALKYYRAAGILGHAGALTIAGSLLISGDYRTPRDVSTGVKYLRRACARGQAEAQSLMGTLHASGLAERYGVEKNMAKAILYWNFSAADLTNTFAATALGYRYHKGEDLPANCPLAAKFYDAAAKEVARNPTTWPSARNFMYGLPPLPSKLRNPESERLTDEAATPFIPSGGGGEGGDADVLHYYRHSAARGNLDAQTTIGALQFFGGHGVPRDEVGAENILAGAARAGNGDANAILAHIKMRRDDDPVEVLALFKKAANEGNKHGHYALGMVYLHGLLGQGVDYSLSRQHFGLAYDSHPEAAFQLGRMYSKGLGIPQNRKEAFRNFQQGARLGNVQCIYALGVYFLKAYGPVITPDCEQAVPYFKRVAEKGEWRHVLDSAANYYAKRDTFGALHRYLQAAYAGIELGQFNAAMVLEKTPEDHGVQEMQHWDRRRLVEEARNMYLNSAKQGYASALVRSGNMAYLEMRDYGDAVQSYELGYQLKNAEATFCLGWMYVRGLGTSGTPRNTRKRSCQLLSPCWASRCGGLSRTSR